VFGGQHCDEMLIVLGRQHCDEMLIVLGVLGGLCLDENSAAKFQGGLHKKRIVQSGFWVPS
jgi:hypothetical protein